ncbi:MAG: hypothetical protein V4580_01465 [Bacteroidota bacterium]
MSPLIHKTNYLQLLLSCLCAIGLVWYISYKAYYASFTHDESYSYTHYVHQSFMDIISYKTPYTNNHILNTVLMKYCELFFGSSEMALRLPNCLAFIIYSLFVILLCYRHCRECVWFGYLLFTLNPYLLDFFALARGYGLSVAFLMMSVYYLSVYFTSRNYWHLIGFNLGAFLAVLSNFSLLNYYVAALIVYNSVELISNKHNYRFYQINKVNIVSVIILGLVLYEPLRRISKMNLLDFGGKNGFTEDTIGTAIYSLFYEMHVPDFYLGILKSMVIIVVVSIGSFIVFKFFKRDFAFLKSNLPLVFCNLTLLAIVGMTVLQHHMLGNDYYIHRFALFFYPLFMLNMVFLIAQVYKNGYVRSTLALSSIFVILLGYNLYTNHNLDYFKDWKQDRGVKNAMRMLTAEHQKQPTKQIRLGINWILEPGTNFYRYTLDLKWLNPTHRRGITKYDDYLLLFKKDRDFENLSKKQVLFEDDVTQLILLKNKD